MKAEHKEKGYPYHQGVTGEPGFGFWGRSGRLSRFGGAMDNSTPVLLQKNSLMQPRYVPCFLLLGFVGTLGNKGI